MECREWSCSRAALPFHTRCVPVGIAITPKPSRGAATAMQSVWRTNAPTPSTAPHGRGAGDAPGGDGMTVRPDGDDGAAGTSRDGAKVPALRLTERSRMPHDGDGACPDIRGAWHRHHPHTRIGDTANTRKAAMSQEAWNLTLDQWAVLLAVARLALANGTPCSSRYRSQKHRRYLLPQLHRDQVGSSHSRVTPRRTRLPRQRRPR